LSRVTYERLRKLTALSGMEPKKSWEMRRKNLDKPIRNLDRVDLIILRQSHKLLAVSLTQHSAKHSGDGLADDDNPYMDTALDEAATVVFYAWHRFPHEVSRRTHTQALDKPIRNLDRVDLIILRQSHKFLAVSLR
jgi:hypothetical protein